jgi:hypothetical protein
VISPLADLIAAAQTAAPGIFPQRSCFFLTALSFALSGGRRRSFYAMETTL